MENLNYVKKNGKGHYGLTGQLKGKHRKLLAPPGGVPQNGILKIKAKPEEDVQPQLNTRRTCETRPRRCHCTDIYYNNIYNRMVFSNMNAISKHCSLGEMFAHNIGSNSCCQSLLHADTCAVQ